MRINVYSQELILDEDGPTALEIVADQASNTGVTYSAVRMYLHSSEKLHHPPQDDDRSAITFWLPKSAAKREILAETFRDLAEMVLMAPAETGLD